MPAFLEFDSKNIRIANSKIFREQLNFENVTGKVSVKNYSSPVFNLNNISFTNEQINIVANGFVDIKNNLINITTHIPKVDMRYITNYLPLNFMSKKTGQYFSKSFKNGISKNAFIKINGNISNYPFYENFEGNSYAIFPISQLYVDYRDGWVPFKNVSGTAYFNKKNAYFKSDQLMILDTSMNNANMYISNVTDARLFINGELLGPFVDLLKFSNKASLTNIDVKQINNISGNSKTNFKMKLNFDGKENYYESSIKLNNLSYKLDDNNYLKDIKGKFLSGGQKKKLVIALSLLSEPKVLLLDECFAALDVLTIKMLQEIIVNLQNENRITICICDHQARDLLACVDVAMILSNGKILSLIHI